MRNILITGGAGYIGSHMIKLLAGQGFHPITLDDLSNGHEKAVTVGDFVKGNIADQKLVEQLCQKYQFEGAIHFASSILVGESMSNSEKYYQNNVENTISLIEVLKKHALKYFIFSSTAAIFGTPQYTPIDEKHPTKPINPYGETKLKMEKILWNDSNFKSAALRYFNAAGADPSGEIGESHKVETHLIPLILQVASGKKEYIEIYGNDYPTADGTCVRDYIHVNDICSAHMKLLEYMQAGGTEKEFNLGSGRGYSVKEVIEMTEKVTGKKIKTKIGKHREGDVPILICDDSKAKKLLKWKAERSDIETIIADAWRWESKHG